MERAWEKSLGTALVAIGLGLLLYGFVQAYDYTVHPPTGTYTILQFGGGGGGGGGGGSVNGTFNGRFVEAFAFLGIEYLIGASILRGGWNLITPKAETISVRVKPRSLQIEPAETPTPAPPPAAGGTPPASSGGGTPPGT
jgi:hypothetical protein